MQPKTNAMKFQWKTKWKRIQAEGVWDIARWTSSPIFSNTSLNATDWKKCNRKLMWWYFSGKQSEIFTSGCIFYTGRKIVVQFSTKLQASVAENWWRCSSGNIPEPFCLNSFSLCFPLIFHRIRFRMHFLHRKENRCTVLHEVAGWCCWKLVTMFIWQYPRKLLREFFFTLFSTDISSHSFSGAFFT